MYVVDRKGEKVRFLSEKIGKKCCGLCCRVPCITKNFCKTQKTWLINKSGFKSRAAYDGMRTVFKKKSSRKLLVPALKFRPGGTCCLTNFVRRVNQKASQSTILTFR